MMFVTLLENEHTAGSKHVLASDHTKNTMFVTLVKALALVSQGSGSPSLCTHCSSSTTGTPACPSAYFFITGLSHQILPHWQLTLHRAILCHLLPSVLNSFETSSVIFPFNFLCYQL